MTDAEDTDEKTENKFSFRMFDLYRRFVEVLRLNSNYLMEFKNGNPSQEVCVDVIKKVFLHRQKENSITHYVKYLSKNAKTIANHAENLPYNWVDAIKYTDQCIKLIKSYLRKHSIDYKRDEFDLNSLARDVSEHLHTNPNNQQLQAVTEYLKYDIQNPKRNIKVSKKSKKKSRISNEASEDLDASDSIEETLKVIFSESSKSDNNDDTQDILKQKTDNVQKMLQEENGTSQTKLLCVEKNKRSPEKTFQEESKENCSFEDVDIDIIGEIESPEFESLETLNENFIDDIDETSATFKGLKRNIHCIEQDHEYMKKICLSKDCYEQDHQKNQNQPIIYNETKSSEDNVQVSVVDASKSKFAVIGVKEENNSKMNTSKEDLLNILEDVKVEEDKDNILIDFNDKILTLKDISCLDSEQNHLNLTKMTYYDAYKLMEIITKFCSLKTDLKNEISVEEFLILRRTKDLMHWKSLKDVKNVKQEKH